MSSQDLAATNFYRLSELQGKLAEAADAANDAVVSNGDPLELQQQWGLPSRAAPTHLETVTKVADQLESLYFNLRSRGPSAILESVRSASRSIETALELDTCHVSTSNSLRAVRKELETFKSSEGTPIPDESIVRLQSKTDRAPDLVRVEILLALERYSSSTGSEVEKRIGRRAAELCNVIAAQRNADTVALYGPEMRTLQPFCAAIRECDNPYSDRDESITAVRKLALKMLDSVLCMDKLPK